MLTETQKNFRKQMKLYKNRDLTGEDEIFSYIENEMISGYYSVKSKKTYKKSIPAAAILFIIIAIGLKIYNYKITNLSNAYAGVPQIISSINLNNNGNEHLNRVHGFLNDMNNINMKQNSIAAQYNYTVSEYNSGEITKKGFIIRIEEMKGQLKLISGECENIKAIEGMEHYHNLAKSGISLQWSFFEGVILKQNTVEVKYDTIIDRYRSDIDNNCNKMKQELISIFDGLGIEYNIKSNGDIMYTMRY
ncbi:MAG TPA: hypothetical protein VEG39_15875 [Clostridia bacterium]|nr:hypothetical protein [Clostridia bacterium]